MKIIIVWAWTAWWLCASLIKKEFWDKFEVILIADEKIWTIWVWEASLSSIKNIFDILEIPHDFLIKHANWTIKMGIKFENWWFRDFVNPYDWINEKILKDYIQNFIYLKNNDSLKYNFDELSSKLPFLIEKNLFYREDKYEWYAYHFDTSLLANLLKEYCLNIWVKYINSNIDINNIVKEWDFIKSIKIDNEVIEWDFFIDCSWFSSILLNGIYKQEFNFFWDELICDQCIVTSFNYEDHIYLRKPYTTSIAMKNWWLWQIPLKNRLSVWYVYSSKFASKDDIIKEIEEFFPFFSNQNYKNISIKSWFYEKSWIWNTLGIGLSSWFIEPLESTWVMLIYSWIFKFFDVLKDINFDLKNISNYNEQIEAFNQLTKLEFLDIKEFIKFHYYVSLRKWEFWNEARKRAYNIDFEKILKMLYKEDDFFFEKYMNMYTDESIIHNKTFKDWYLIKNVDTLFFWWSSYCYFLFGTKKIPINKKLYNLEKITKLQFYFYKKYISILKSIKNNLEDYNLFLDKNYGSQNS